MVAGIAGIATGAEQSRNQTNALDGSAQGDAGCQEGRTQGRRGKCEVQYRGRPGGQ